MRDGSDLWFSGGGVVAVSNIQGSAPPSDDNWLVVVVGEWYER